MFKKFNILMGILTRRVFAGPLEVSIDITNRCNLGCMTCWFYSPLRKDKVDESWANQQMDFDFFKRIIDEMKSLDVKKIMIGGDGEPFLHPHAIEMLEYAKKAKFIVDTATCGVYFNEENLRRLFDLGIDGLNISILAATPQTYLSMHPTQKEELFERVKQSIEQLSKWKKEENKKQPLIRLVMVICNLNYFEVNKMIDFAKEVGADAISFKRLATMPFTKGLLLNENQVKELDERLGLAMSQSESAGIAADIKQFRNNILSGFTNGDYTSKIYTQLPCYIGWLYSRILCDGSVVPCCGCWSYRIDNLHNYSFKEIWHSKKYSAFRKKSIGIAKDASITKECACHSCAHSGMNMGIYRRLHFLKRVSDA